MGHVGEGERGQEETGILTFHSKKREPGTEEARRSATCTFVRDAEETTNTIGSGNLSDRCPGANGPRGDPEFVRQPWRTMGMHAAAKTREGDTDC